MVVLHLHTEHPGETFLSLQMLQAEYFCALLMPVKRLEHISSSFRIFFKILRTVGVNFRKHLYEKPLYENEIKRKDHGLV